MYVLYIYICEVVVHGMIVTLGLSGQLCLHIIPTKVIYICMCVLVEVHNCVAVYG